MTDGNEREHETKHELAEDDEQIIQNLIDDDIEMVQH
jgi:hypothetical protein